jgi:hypothetical protein
MAARLCRNRDFFGAKRIVTGATDDGNGDALAENSTDFIPQAKRVSLHMGQMGTPAAAIWRICTADKWRKARAMNMLKHSWIGVFGLGLLLPGWLASAWAQAPTKFQAPPQSVAFEDAECKLADVQGDAVQIRDSRSEAWWLKVGDGTKVTVKGEAEEECLKSGVYVQLNAEIDKKGTLSEPVSKIEIVSFQSKPTLGLFHIPKTAVADGEDEEAKPVKNAGPGEYRIRGKLALFRDGEIVILAGNRKLTGDVAEELHVTVNVDDLSVAQAGDEVEVKAWYYDPDKPVPVANRPGKAWAEEINVKLAKKLAPVGKKPRPAEKPNRPVRSKAATRN